MREQLLSVLVASLLASVSAFGASDVPPRTYRDPGHQARLSAQRSSLPSLRQRLAPAPYLRLSAVTREEVLGALEKASLRAPLAGIHRSLHPSSLAAGRWEPLPGGHWLWRLSIEAPGAQALRLHFADFSWGQGRAWIHDGQPDRAQVFGPYDGGEFWGDVIVGDTLVIEYESLAADANLAAPPFRIDRIAHLLGGILPGRPALDADPGILRSDPKALEAAVDRLLLSSANPPRDAAGSCHLDAACYGDWADTTRSVGWMVFETPEGTSICSGTLLNTRNGSSKPYFLTADHCISDNAGAQSLQVFWFYQASTCDGTPPDPRNVPRSRGRSYLGGKSYQQGDSSLVLLDQLPDGVVFSGWTLDTPPEGSQITGVSHPGGAPKKISFGVLGPRAADSGVQAGDEDFYGVTYSDRGLVEPGSSGSALFASPGVLVGILSHGRKPTDRSQEAYCNFLPFAVNYGRFNVSYPLFRDLLEDRTTVPSPPASSADARRLTSGESAVLNLNPVSSPTLFTGSAAFQIDVPQGATRLDVRLSFTTPGADVALFIRKASLPAIEGGRVIADYSAEDPGGSKSFAITASSTPPLSAGTYFITIGVRTTGQALSGALVATVTGGATQPPPSGNRTLTSGQPVSFALGPVTGGTLYSGTSGYSISVPQDATRLEIRLTTSTPGTDVDLFARYGQDVSVSGGNVATDHKSEGQTGDETIIITPSSSPPLRTGTYYIAFGLFTANVTANCTVVATVTTGGTPPPSTRALTSGQPVSFTLGPASVATLYNGDYGYTISVPQNSTRLEIRLTTSNPGVDIDLYARYGQDVGLSGSNAVADHRSEGDGGNESLVITPSGTPTLRAGIYYIAFGLFTKGVTANCSIIATVTGGGQPPPSGGPAVLTSGQPASFNIGPVSYPTLFNGSSGFTVSVPQGATRLEVKLHTTTPGVDVDLYARRGTDVSLNAQKDDVFADHRSERPDGEETIEITANSTPPLSPGTYYIALGLFTGNLTAQGSVTATVTTTAAPPPTSGNQLVSGQPRTFNIAPVTSARLLNGASGFTIQVPQNSTRLEIRLTSPTPKVDIDIYARFGSDSVFSGGRVVADHYSEAASSDEYILVTPTSNPPLRAGTYFIALAMFTPNTPASATISATVSPGSGSPSSGGSRILTSGVPAAYAAGPVDTPSLRNGANGFQINVPQGSTRLEIQLRTQTSNVDVDLYARAGQDVALLNGSLVADALSEGPDGNETIVIAGNSLKPGSYFIALGLFTLRTSVTGSITATVSSPAPTPTGPAVLSSGVFAPFRLGPASNSTLYYGSNSFVIDVPENAARLDIRLSTATAGADVDLHARFGTDTAVVGGSVVADHSSEGPAGAESVSVTATSNPPLRAGRYYISLALYTLDVEVSGTVTATIIRSGGAPPAPSSATSLTLGTPAKFSLPAVQQASLFTGPYSFFVSVPEGASRLTIRLASDVPSIDTDLFVRFGADVELSEGNVVSDYQASTDTGNEQIIITPASSPPLKPGTYYISLGLFTAGAPATGTITASVERAAVAPHLFGRPSSERCHNTVQSSRCHPAHTVCWRPRLPCRLAERRAKPLHRRQDGGRRGC